MNTEKARIAHIPFGDINLEVLQLPDGNYCISVGQISQLLPNLISPTHETRSVKRLLGKTSKLARIKKELSKAPVNVISLEELETVIVEASIRGDEDAHKLIRILVGLSLNQLCHDAFGVAYEKEQRTQYVASRWEHMKSFHPRLTIWWKTDGCKTSKDYQDRVIEFKEMCGLSKFKKIDHMSKDELRIINQKETAYHALRRSGLDHDTALKYI